jgi:hypothetical protein
LLAARVALPSLLSGKPVVFALALFYAALGAYRLTIRPAKRGYYINADLLVGIVADSFDESFWKR